MLQGVYSPLKAEPIREVWGPQLIAPEPKHMGISDGICLQVEGISAPLISLWDWIFYAKPSLLWSLNLNVYFWRYFFYNYKMNIGATYMKGELEISISHELRCQNPQWNISKLNPTVYKMNASSFNNNNNNTFYLALLCPSPYAKLLSYILSFNHRENPMR